MRSDDSVLHPKHTHNVWREVLIVSRQYDWKIFWSNFDDFFGSGNHQSSKKLKPSTGTYPQCLEFSSYCLLSVQLKNISAKFWRLFLSPNPLEQEKLKTGQITHFCTQKLPTFLGCSSYCFSSIRLKNVSIEFWWVFWVRTPPELA